MVGDARPILKRAALSPRAFFWCRCAGEDVGQRTEPRSLKRQRRAVAGHTRRVEQTTALWTLEAAFHVEVHRAHCRPQRGLERPPAHEFQPIFRICFLSDPRCQLCAQHGTRVANKPALVATGDAQVSSSSVHGRDTRDVQEITSSSLSLSLSLSLRLSLSVSLSLPLPMHFRNSRSALGAMLRWRHTEALRRRRGATGTRRHRPIGVLVHNPGSSVA